MEENTNLTIFQKLSQAFGTGTPKAPDQATRYQYQYNSPIQNREIILKTNDRQEFEKEKLERQQQAYLVGQWAKTDSELYRQSVYYETTRLASYYDFEAMEFSIAGDTKIATPDGFITIKELADKGRDHEFIVYAYDHNQQKVVPAWAKNAHCTRNEMTYKITFDDGTFIIATYGHRFLKRDGVFCKLEDLKVGDSMMPFYRKSFYNNEKYNWIYSCNSDEGYHGWVAEHNLIAEWFYQDLQENEVVHHVDFNGKNNNPDNLLIQDKKEHQAFHARHNNQKLWQNPEYRQKMIEISRRTDNKHHWNGARKGINNPSYVPILFSDIVDSAKIHRTIAKTAKDLNISIHKIQNELSFNGFKNWFDFLDIYGIKRYIPNVDDYDSINFKKIPWDLLVDTAKKCKTIQLTADTLKVKPAKIMSTVETGGFKNWKTFMAAYGLETGKAGRKKPNIINHKIVSIEPHEVIPVYDLTVPGFKNFATDTIFSHNTPEISAALDIFAEESTTSNDKGQILNVYSDSKRIKKILENLFNNVLDINTNLPAWTRNTCKYGDNMVYLKMDRERGIVGCTQLPNIEMERKEFHLETIYKNITNEKKQGIQFNWKNKDLSFQSWEVAHFRLVGDDRKLPYGTSMLEKARRIWKQLLLSEDAMLIYRTSRAPERRVFKVFVGNMDDDDVEGYIQKVANKFKRSMVVDSKTGQIDTRYNQLAVDQDFFIPVRDPNAPNPIDTLPGATNLAEIADVEYIQKKLFAALRTPKAFLGFEDVAGDGKNLALKDIRFARTINRIQQSMIQELNKIAIIHLYVLGFEDDIDNFTLSLNNPSTQAELMKIESLKEKAQLYKDLVSDAGNGFSITSMTWAKKNVMDFSEDEIRLDLEQQRLEKAAANELAKTTEIIIHTGIFDNIDKIFGKRADQEGEEPAAGGAEGGAPSGGGGGFGGGGGLGDLGGGMGGELGGAAGGEEFPAPGEEALPGAEGEETPAGEENPPEENEPKEEGFLRQGDQRPLLIENRISYDINEMLDSLDEMSKKIDNDDEGLNDLITDETINDAE